MISILGILTPKGFVRIGDRYDQVSCWGRHWPFEVIGIEQGNFVIQYQLNGESGRNCRIPIDDWAAYDMQLIASAVPSAPPSGTPKLPVLPAPSFAGMPFPVEPITSRNRSCAPLGDPIVDRCDALWAQIVAGADLVPAPGVPSPKPSAVILVYPERRDPETARVLAGVAAGEQVWSAAAGRRVGPP